MSDRASDHPVSPETGATSAAAYVARELPPGSTLERYIVLKRIGQGGMGAVYVALDTELERRVAIKILHTPAAARASVAEVRARLLREAQAMAKVSHPNVVAVYEVGTFRDEVFLAMEYVSGQTLRAWGAEKKRSARETVVAYLQAGRGLEAAHAVGLLHRDFKPDNVLVDAAGRARVLDFGLARLDPNDLGPVAPESQGSVALGDTGVLHKDALAAQLTGLGEMVGTPAYMAPEQLLGERATAKSDQLSFCLALYEALYAELPFGGETVSERAAAMRDGCLKPVPKDARVPGAMRRVLLRGLSAEPERRFGSMTELLAALERTVASPRSFVAAAVLGAAAIAGAAVFAARPAPPRPCQGAAGEIAPAWSDARAGEMERAFKASGNVGAGQALAHLRPILDRYAASWVAMHVDACEATRVRGEQSSEALDLRMACLQQREKELKATVDLFSRADAKLVDQSVLAASRLTAVDTCVDVASLRAPFAPPKDEAQRRTIDDLRRRIAELDALNLGGRHGEAYPLAVAVVEEASRADYGPVLAEALLRKGRAEAGSDNADAHQTTTRAALEAEAARHDVVAADAWILLTTITSNRTHEEEVWAKMLAEAALRRVHGSDVQWTRLRVAEAWDAYRRGAQDEALGLAREALALAEKTPSESEIFNAQGIVADALWDRGDFEEALSIDEALYRDSTALLGEAHPNCTRTLGDIGETQMLLGDYPSALHTLDLALDPKRLRRAEVAAYARAVYGATLVGMGRVAEGIASFEEGMRVMKEHHATADSLASDAAGFARALVERQVDREAETYARSALLVLDQPDGREEDRGGAYAIVALVKARRGDAKGAIDDADKALAVKAKQFGVRADLIPLLARGQALLSLRRGAEGLADLERALTIADATRGDLALRADVRFAVARALGLTGGDASRANELAARAAEELDRVGLGDAARAVRGWMGKHG